MVIPSSVFITLSSATTFGDTLENAAQPGRYAPEIIKRKLHHTPADWLQAVVYFIHKIKTENHPEPQESTA